MSKKTLNKLVSLLCASFLIAPMIKVQAAKVGEFKNTIPVAERTGFNGKVFTSKPLVVLMDFADYDHKDLDKREEWSINGFKGEECTKEHYNQLFFGEDTYKAANGGDYITVKKFFKEESGDSYNFQGGVAGWYKADHEAKYYGANDPEYWDSDQNNATKLIMEAFQKLLNDPTIDLSQYDVEDKFDYNHNGNYYEPDGIIDTLVVLHAGIGEEHGGGSLGDDAIWPFRAEADWYESSGYKMPEGKDTKGRTWKAKNFITMSQDLPTDLFVHEYGHDLGLPDLYSGGAEPPVSYWSVMGGSYTGPVRGAMPNSYGAFARDDLQKRFNKMGYDMRWQNKKIIDFKDLKPKGIDVVLDQASIKGNNLNNIELNLPQLEKQIVKPFSGKSTYFSGKGDNLSNEMTVELNLNNYNSSKLEFMTWYSIDPEYDFASVQVKEKGSDKWTAIKGNITTDQNPNDETPEDPTDRNPGQGITYDSGNQWIKGEFDLSAYVGKEIELKFKLWTDTNTPEEGIYIDDIKIFGDDKIIFQDDAEGSSKFNLKGFAISNGIEKSDHRYFLEWRNSENGAIDNGLAKFPWKGWEDVKFDPGLVMWYVRDKFMKSNGKSDQNVKSHPGECHVGVVDADQQAVYWTKGEDKGADKGAFQMKDAAFSLRQGSPLDIQWSTGSITKDPSIAANPYFDDSKDYTNKEKTQLGLVLQNYGLKVFVTDESKNRSSAKIHLTRADVNKATYQELSNIKDIKVRDGKILIYTTDEFSEKANVRYVSPDGKQYKDVSLNYVNGVYEGSLDFAKDITEPWKIEFITMEDKEGNAKAFYNVNVNKVFGADLSNGDTVQAPEIEVLAINDGETYDSLENIQFKIYNFEKYTVLLNEKPYNGEAVKEEGDYVFKIMAEGKNGLNTERVINFKIKNVPKESDGEDKNPSGKDNNKPEDNSSNTNNNKPENTSNKASKLVKTGSIINIWTLMTSGAILIAIGSYIYVCTKKKNIE